MSRPGPESAGPPSPLLLAVGTPGHGSASIHRRHEPIGARRHGATELHSGAPGCTDSRQRRISTQFSTQRGCAAEPRYRGLFTRGIYSVNKMRLIQLQVSVYTYCYYPCSNGPGSEKTWIDSTFA